MADAKADSKHTKTAESTSSGASSSSTASASKSDNPKSGPRTFCSLNDLCHDYTDHNKPRGEAAGNVLETVEQMVARNAVTDAHILNTLPDVVFMQEVGTTRMKSLLSRTQKDYHAFLAPNVKADSMAPEKGGCAVLVRRGVGLDKPGCMKGHVFVFASQRPKDKKRRVAMVVCAKHDDDREEVYVSVHLEGAPTAEGDGLRLAQLAEVVTFARRHSAKGTIYLGGDFNHPLEKLEVVDKMMEKLQMYRVDNTQITFPEKNQVLDYIYVSDALLAAQAKAWVHPPNRTKDMPLPPFAWAGLGSDHCVLHVWFPPNE